MKRQSFGDNWLCYPKGNKAKAIDVSIPHDAMQLDGRGRESAGGKNTGWYLARDYIYEKEFIVPEEYIHQKSYLEFEGVYHKAKVFINGKKVCQNNSGYLLFCVPLNGNIRYGTSKNVIRVEAVNSDQPNSRWYTGTGIYRQVWLCHEPQNHIVYNGIKVKTLDVKRGQIKVSIQTSEPGELHVEILGDCKVVAEMTGKVDELEKSWKAVCEIPNVQLWSHEHPYLYQCRVKYRKDERIISFGVRQITCSKEDGFCLNGERVILKGACIHHDNGLLGACAYPFAERRKIKILKKNGFNAIRSAHNPCSEALLRACDEEGMLVIDEYADAWYIHKTRYDYAEFLRDCWQQDLNKIVDRDYNHPSVIMYSLGNEVSETAQRKGIQLCRHMQEHLHKIDDTRPVTCGVNILFNFLSSIGLGVYSSKKAEKESQKKTSSVGSEFYNQLAGSLGASFMKTAATLRPCDIKTRAVFEILDVAGYNYGVLRYRKDLKKYPNRLILGTETFAEDAILFYETAQKNKRLLGDFVWSGFDYLGEIGLGAWEYKADAPDFSFGPGWVSAGAGRIDLTGKPLAEMSYMRMVYDIDKIGLAVVPVNHASEKHTPAAWRMTNAIESWSWSGCEGMETAVEVYAKGYEAAIFINQKCVGKKRIARSGRTIFPVRYEDGEITAKVYDSKGKVLAETSLYTSGKETMLRAEPENDFVKKTDELCYIRFRYTDEAGILKPMEKGRIKVDVKGGRLLAFGNACPYCIDGYQRDEADTYYGEALAVIKPWDAEKIIAHAKCVYGECQAEIAIV